jgi:hypothetical protein
MEKNKTGKYLKYAIGEIVLVVIGILIALQINNWNEARKLENMGKVFIGEIYTDLENEVSNLNEILKGLNEQYEGTEYILSFFESSEKVIMDTLWFTKNHWAPSKIFIIQRNKNTYDELSSSGQIGLLKNDSLSKGLEQFYKDLDIRISNFQEYPLQIRMELRNLTFPMGNVKDAKKEFFQDKLTTAFIQEYLSNQKVYEALLSIYKTCRYNIEFFNKSLIEAKKLIIEMQRNYPELNINNKV